MDELDNADLAVAAFAILGIIGILIAFIFISYDAGVREGDCKARGGLSMIPFVSRMTE